MKNSGSSAVLNRFEDILLNSTDLTLPGHEILPLVVDSPGYLTPPPPDSRQAAVVLMIHASRGIPSLLFIQRSEHIMDDKHRGQIAFPGGQQEKNESLKECAFREMEEEIGLRLSIDHPTRQLSPLYVSVSNFLIHPFVAFKDELPSLHPNPEEVATIIDSPLTDLDKRYTIHKKDLKVRGKIISEVPYFQIAGKTLWGATALIFSELLYLIDQNL